MASRQALLFVMVEAFVYIPAYSCCAAIIVVSAFPDRHAVILVRKHIPLFQSCTVVICGRWALLFIQAVKPALMKPCQTREPRGPLPSGGNSAANLLSLKRPARIARGSGCRGLALLSCGLSRPAFIKFCQTREPRGPLPSGGNSAANLLSLERPARIARSPGYRTLSLPSGRLFRPALMKPCQIREPRGPLPSGGNSTANLLSLKCPARIARSPGCRGTAPATAPCFFFGF